jgi:hypothetical protein
MGVVALSNAMTSAGVDDIGWHLLDTRYGSAAAVGTQDIYKVFRVVKALRTCIV